MDPKQETAGGSGGSEPGQDASGRRVSLLTQVLYAMGALATSLKARAISTFLVLFYNQVVGLPPRAVGLVLMTAMVFDAIIDPLVGQVSDNLRSRWGRRHPFMIASAAPYAIAFYLIWNPPLGWTHGAILVWLAVLIFTLRLVDTFFELPHQALAPELVRDYDSRTRLVALRHFFTVAGGLGMQFMAYQVFLKENPDGSGGVLAREGYLLYSIVGSILILAAITISTLGTLNQVPHLKIPVKRKTSLATSLREMTETLSNRPFVILTATLMVVSIAIGVREGLEIYIGLYFWNLTQAQLAGYAAIGVLGGLCGLTIAPTLGARMGKKRALITVFISGVLVHVTPITLRLIGMAPPNGTVELVTLVYCVDFLYAVLQAATAILGTSIAAEIVEYAEIKTGRRSEGLLLSANNLMRKMVSGGGVFLATTLLTLTAFPIGVDRDEVSQDVLNKLGAAYVPTILFLNLTGALIVSFFNIDRRTHEANLRTLRERSAT